MKKTFLLLLICIVSAIGTQAQTKDDYNTATVNLKNYYNQLQTDSMYSMLSDRLKTLMPEDKMEDQFKQLYAQAGEIKACVFSKEEKGLYFYKTVFSNAILTMIISLTPDYKLSTFRFIPYQEDTTAVIKEKSNFILKTATGDLYGTLAMPETTKKVPVVLIIAGSGPTDRNGNNKMGVTCNAYKMLADSLQKAGIASVRYDKRGIGESSNALKDEESVTFEDMVKDAEGFATMLKEDKRFSSVFVMGHSEGSLIGMIISEKEKVAGYISLSGIAERADKIIEKQINTNSPALEKVAEVIFDSLDKGYKVKDIDSDLLTLFHPSIQPYLISWLKYEPKQEIKKLKIPVLIIQGTTDIQVSVDEAQALKKADPRATLKIIDGMNHILKQAPADRDQNIATYSEPSLPLSPGLMPAIIKFINADVK